MQDSTLRGGSEHTMIEHNGYSARRFKTRNACLDFILYPLTSLVFKLVFQMHVTGT
jgi:hypothetical protein